MTLLSILILMLSQAAIADVTAKNPIRENCQQSACTAQVAGSVGHGGSPGDVRVLRMQEKEGTQPSAGAGGKPPGSSYKNRNPKPDKTSPQPSAGAGGEPPGAAYNNRPPPLPKETHRNRAD